MDDINNRQFYQARRRKSFDELSDLYAYNYGLARKLMPFLSDIRQDIVAYQKQKQPLYLLFEKRTPYTGTYRLTHCFEGVNRPDICFKVYFDAKLIEVISVCSKTSINSNQPYLYDCSDITLRWEINYLLNNWLGYCLRQGYIFLFN